MCPVSLHPPERCLTFLVQNLGFVLGRGKENGRGRLRCEPLFSWSGTLVAEGICTHFTKRVTEAQKRKGSGLPWWSSGLDSTLAAQGAGVPSLEGTLGSHMPYGTGKKKKKKRKASAQVCPSRERGSWAGLGCWFPGLTPHRRQALRNGRAQACAGSPL